MIDELKAREAVEEMSRNGLQNLLTALEIERQLYLVFSLRELDAHYSPPTATMLITTKMLGSRALANIAQVVRTSVRMAPASIAYYGRRVAERSGMRMSFAGGLAVLIRIEKKEESNGL